MKKILSVLCCFLLFFSFTITTFGAGIDKTYTVKDQGFTITIPGDWYTVTLNTPDDDPNWELTGRVPEELKSNFILNAFDPERSLALSITRSPTQAKNTFDDYLPEQLLDLCTGMKSAQTIEGYSVLSAVPVASSRGMTFIYMEVSVENEIGNFPTKQFIFCNNQEMISLTFQTGEKAFSTEMIQKIKSIVDSTQFITGNPSFLPTTNIVISKDLPTGNQENISSSSSKTKPTVYSNSETGVQFPIPDGWEEVPTSVETDICFSTPSANAFSFEYHDVWPLLTPEERKGISRQEINNNYLTKEIAGSLLHSAFKISSTKRKTLNQIEYYRIEATLHGLPAECYLLCSNGWVYFFSYIGDKNSPDYQAFLNILTSVEYKNDELSPFSSDASMLNDVMGLPVNASASEFWFALIFSLLATIAVYTLPIVIYRFRVSKRPISPHQAKRIVWIYGACAFIFTLILGIINGDLYSGGAVLLWSGVNYFILCHGFKNTLDSTENPKEMPAPLSGDIQTSVPATALEKSNSSSDNLAPPVNEQLSPEPPVSNTRPNRLVVKPKAVSAQEAAQLRKTGKKQSSNSQD